MTPIDNYFELHRTNPSDINEHMGTLKEYAQLCDHITEMGVRGVVSTWAFLAARPRKLVTVDINPCAVDQAALHAKNEGIEFEFRLSSTVDPNFSIEETDLLFIDTWHVYSQLKTEFEMHAGKARKYIILHDTTTFGETGENHVRGLWPAIEEFLQEHPEWELHKRFTHNNGLTILSRL